jgi:hypothetical protein
MAQQIRQAEIAGAGEGSDHDAGADAGGRD